MYCIVLYFIEFITKMLLCVLLSLLTIVLLTYWFLYFKCSTHMLPLLVLITVCTFGSLFVLWSVTSSNFGSRVIVSVDAKAANIARKWNKIWNDKIFNMARFSAEVVEIIKFASGKYKSAPAFLLLNCFHATCCQLPHLHPNI